MTEQETIARETERRVQRERRVQYARAVGERIKQLRTVRELSSRDLAERAGIAHSTVKNIEGGSGGTLATLHAIATALAVAVADLLPRTATTTQSSPAESGRTQSNHQQEK